MYNKNGEKKSNDRGNKNCWVAAILGSRSERGNKQYFNLSLNAIQMYNRELFILIFAMK
jgi:hypothetical protein